MKRYLIPFGLLCCAIYSEGLNAQLVTSDPAIPTIRKSVTVFFDATKGNAGLKGYTGEVYAHTGVLTTKSSSTGDWKFVKTDWGQNTPETKMERISADYYKLEISPDIRSYYGIPESETVTHLAFVFRSGQKRPGSSSYYEGKDEGNKDIFIEVFEEGLNVTLVKPAVRSLIVDLNESIEVKASASGADSISLFINNKYIKTSDNRDSLVFTLNADDYGDNNAWVIAYGGQEQAADSFFYYVRKPIVESPLPTAVIPGINYTSDTSVTLVLYAPMKESVFVIGDFTSWSVSDGGAMKRTPDGEHFWQEFGGLEPLREYRFQYLVDGNIKIADPYADKFLDFWNDKYITEETYPGLIPYPAGKTEEMVSVLQTAQQPYEWKYKDFTPPEKTKLVIYELLVRDFIAAHDFKTLTDTLNYLDSLGINAIELMPFNEFDGNISWGYNPAFYFAPDKYYGPKNTLKAFVDSCHGRGIAVIQDMVLNHSFGQHSLGRLYLNEQTGQPSPENPWYNESAPNPVYNWGWDFNHESQATKDFVDRVNAYWLTEYNMDGFRFDFTKGFTNTPGDGWAYDAPRINILKRMADTIWKVNPDAYVILEHFSDNQEEKELADYGMMIWGNINYEFAEAAMGYESNLSWASARERGWNHPHLVAYMESHDEERNQYKVKTWGASNERYDTKVYPVRLERGELAALFLLSIPGPKMIWQFGEQGYSISIGDESKRTDPKPILWDNFEDKRRQRMYRHYQALLRLRENHPVFHTDDYNYRLSDYQKRINLNHPEMNVTLIGNFSITPAKIDPGFQSTGTWYEYFTGSVLDVSDVNDSIFLLPGEYQLFTDKPLSPPEIVGTEKIHFEPDESFEVSVYPNPSQGDVFIEISASPDEAFRVGMYDISGKSIGRVNRIRANPGQTLFRWNGRRAGGIKASPGLYFVRVIGEKKVETIKILVQ